MSRINKEEYENEKIKIKQNQERLDNLEGFSQGILTRIDKLEPRVDGLEPRVDGLEPRVDGLEPRVDGLEPRVDELEERLNGEYANEKIKTEQNQKRLDVLENEMRALRRELQRQYNKEEQGVLAGKFNFLNKITNSQSGEDAIMAYVLSRLKIPFEACRYLDLGANRPVEGSNTNFFYQRGATGVLVEANPELIPMLEEQRKGDVILNRCIDNEEGKILRFYIMTDDGLSSPNLEQVKEIQKKNPDIHVRDIVDVNSITVNCIMQEYFQGKAPEILSVDVEGKDLEILQSIDFQNYRPLLIVIEMIEYETSAITFEKNKVIYDYMINQGYREFAYTGINSIFVDVTNDLVIKK